MSQAPARQPQARSTLVRVTVTSGHRRVDLVLPGAVPLVELLPELARSVGLLDPSTVHGGYRVDTADGRRLDTDTGLDAQGVHDGAVLALSAGVDQPAPRVYDDVVEAMTDAVEHDLRPWDPAAGRRTALVAAALLLALAAVALFAQRGADLAGAAGAAVAVALVAGAVLLSRAQHEAEAAVTVGWLAALHAVVAGLLLAPGDDLIAAPLGEPLAWAGGGALAVGLACLAAMGPGRILAFPPAVAGAVALVVGLLGRADAGPEPDLVLVTVLTIVVLLGSVFPWLALGATGIRADQLTSSADIVADPDEVDAARIAADARLAHELLLAISGCVALLLVLVAPLAVGLGLSGTLLAVAACVVVMLRTRHYRTGSEVLLGLGAGVAGLVVVAGSVLLAHPDWRPTLAVVLAMAGAVLLAATTTPRAPSIRRGRVGDLLETVALLALLPLLVTAVGLVDAAGELL